MIRNIIPIALVVAAYVAVRWYLTKQATDPNRKALWTDPRAGIWV